MKKRILVLLIACLTYAPSALAEQRDYYEESQRMDWWKDARFGIFIHWGLYAQPGGDYKGKRVDKYAEHLMHKLKIPYEEYKLLADEFNPTSFDADQWVKTIADAGMKYVVFTTKHHEGFSMWDTAASNYNIVDATPFKRDVVKELSAACKKHGIRFGIYYSCRIDWSYGPNAKGEEAWKTFRDEKMIPQLTELLTQYGDVSSIWLDGLHQDKKRIYNLLRNLQPNVIINMLDRETGAGDYRTSAGGITHDVDFEGLGLMLPSWGHVNNATNWYPKEQPLKGLIANVSNSGNYLLNVGPNGKGAFPPEAVERLEFIGDWMRINGESIHGATAVPLTKPEWGYYTVNLTKKQLYLHIEKWPESGTITYPQIPRLGMPKKNQRKAVWLGAPGVDLKIDNNSIELPPAAKDVVYPVIAIKLR